MRLVNSKPLGKIATFVLGNGLFLGLGLVYVLNWGHSEIPRNFVVLFCLINYTLGRLAERVFSAER